MPVAGDGEDPFNRVNTAELRDGKVVGYSSATLPGAAFSTGGMAASARKATPPAKMPDKLHPELGRQTSAASGSALRTVVVTFAGDIDLPRFPEPDMTQAKSSAVNVAARSRAADMVGQVAAMRAPAFARRAADLRSRYGAEMLETFWLVNAATMRVPSNAIRSLSQDPAVLYVEPVQTGARPPDSISNNDVDDGRARMSSDPYFNLGQTSGWIGLLDTGVRRSHVQFNNPSHISIVEDCTSGTCRSTPNPADDCWNHGTSSAGIITANSRQGNAYRGVTGITLDSFKIYPASCGFLDTAATLAAFQRAVAVLDRVIVAEMQGGGNEQSSISLAADNAFNAGAVVIAANGNNGPNAGTVNSPANAHKVIGVGNFDVRSLAQVTSQSRGPTSDNRFKPDIQAPTNTETASNASDTALRVFTGTSGATPYAAGAAALVRNFIRGTASNIDPGQVYAFLIMAGQTPYPFNNTSGAGRLVLPTNGNVWWGKTTVGNNGTVDISLPIGAASANTLDAALWWPEGATQAHNDVDLSLIRPNNAIATSSISGPSVFERVRVAGAVTTGTWKLRIRGFSVPTGSQTVYWAAHVRR
ncbi:MAG TPA: S8 family serine peptidase [Geminicoccaceae bacterium]|nr:S8 family serine peptidase [Geminicoccus sp.]HMU52055.1 S8 family serine peptidase [Geminicoccaceae bacterium]